jgi:hypothetical protein
MERIPRGDEMTYKPVVTLKKIKGRWVRALAVKLIKEV